MNALVRAMGTMMDGGPATLLNLKGHEIWSAELAPGYTVSNWVLETEHDLKEFLYSLSAKISDLDDADEDLRGRFYESEFALSQVEGELTGQAVEALGLGAAFIFSGIGLSVRSEDRWGQVQIRLRYRWLDENCRWQVKRVAALNLSEPFQVKRLSKLILDQTRQDLWKDPRTLAERKQDYFPHLAFGLDVTRHLEDFPRTHLRSVATKLLNLDGASRAWRRDPTKTHPILPKCHPESQTTMERFGDQREFRDPDGERVVYELHCMVGNAYRIHLRVTHNPRGIEIGYIGHHLDTR